MSGKITHEWNGTVLIITSDSGTSGCDLKGAQGEIGIRGPQGVPGRSFGSVNSVNGFDGDVVLTASDIGALPDTTEIPSIEGLATEAFVTEAIGGIPSVDLSGYYTKIELNSLIPTIPVSTFINDAGYQTAADVTAIVNEQLGVIENGTY